MQIKTFIGVLTFYQRTFKKLLIENSSNNKIARTNNIHPPNDNSIIYIHIDYF